MTGLDDFLPAEEKVQEVLGDPALDFRAMAVVSDLFRTSAAIRRPAPRREGRSLGHRVAHTRRSPHDREALPRFNAEEVSVTDHLRPDQQEALASMLRSMLRRVGTDAAG